MIPVAPLIVNDVSYVTRINHHSNFAWQVQYFVTLEDAPITPRIINNVLYATDSNHACRFVAQCATGVARCSTL